MFEMNVLAFLSAVKTLLVELTLLFSVSCNIILSQANTPKFSLRSVVYINFTLYLIPYSNGAYFGIIKKYGCVLHAV
ncbi:hypothetical protein HpCK61_04890 [Helicobacter pylori]